jgi:hypothetical protein
MRRFLIAIFFLIGTPGLALAWGDNGHRAVAEIAARYLSETARAQVQDLLGGLEQFVDVASWADDIRDNNERPGTYNWHVVEIPPEGVRYDRVRDCSNDDCIVEKIKEFARIVGDRQIEKSERIDALKFLIHFVGDLHMPLHAYAPLNRPKGTSVRIGNTTEKFHLWWDYVWWDTAFSEAFGSGPSEVAATLVAQITSEQRIAWSGGTVEDWTNESFELSHQFVTKYGIINTLRLVDNSEDDPIVLPDSALVEIKVVVVQRLKMAGVRLAWLLNQALR